MAENKGKTENDIMREACQYLTDSKVFFWRSNNIPIFGRNNAGKMTFRAMPKFSRKGVPDLIIVNRGKFIGIEVKREKAKLRPDQIIFKDDLISNGGFYHVIRSLEECKKLVNYYIKT